MTEQQLQKKIIDHLKKNGFIVDKFQATSSGAFVPDLIGCTPKGQYLAIEVKKENGKMSKGQEAMIYNRKKLSNAVFVVYGYEDYLNKIKEYL